MIGSEMKLNKPVHYQMGNPLHKAGDPVICISRVICPCFGIVHRNLGYCFSIVKFLNN